MILPLVLLSPDGSRTRAGAISPTLLGESITVVSGVYGNAWDIPDDHAIQVSGTGVIPDATAGTILLRCAIDSGLTAAATVVGRNYPRITLSSTYNMRLFDGTTQHNTQTTIPSDTPVTLGIAWHGSVMTGYVNGVRVFQTAERSVAALGSLVLGGVNQTSQNAPGVYESCLAYDVHLTDEQVADICAIDEAWTWDNATIPNLPVATTILTTGNRPLALLSPNQE